jgi:hypothetical protein
MSSRRYISYKFLYDDDTGRTIIKKHRSYLNADGLSEDTPTTALFRARLVDFQEKVTGTSQGLRHVLAYVESRRLIAKIPYAPSNPQLVNHIEEILAEPQVICGDYQGETLITGGNSNSF